MVASSTEALLASGGTSHISLSFSQRPTHPGCWEEELPAAPDLLFPISRGASVHCFHSLKEAHLFEVLGAGAERLPCPTKPRCLAVSTASTLRSPQEPRGRGTEPVRGAGVVSRSGRSS